MYPNQSPSPVPTPPNSLDYLNEISGANKTNTVRPVVLWAGIGGFLLLLIAAVFFVANLSGGPDISQRFASYLFRVQGIEKTAKDNARNIQNSQLRGVNSSLLSIVTGANQGSNEVLGAAGLNKAPTNSDDSPVSTEFAKLTETLEDARLNSQFDRTYARELGYQLAKTRAELTAMSQSTRSQSLKEYLDSTNKNIEPLIEQLNTFSNSAS